MRASNQQGALRLHAIAGTRVVLAAIDIDADRRAGLMGFAFKRERVGGPAGDWLKGLKVFRKNAPNPEPNAQYSTFDNPIQSFLWSDFTARPDTEYRITVAARYGEPGDLHTGDSVSVTVRTEKEDDGRHGVWFNRGSVASQAFAREFHNAEMTDAIANDPKHPMTVWLSRGLLEACLGFIDGTPAGQGLRVCAYEFTYAPVLAALAAALARGVDVRIVCHKTAANAKAIQAAALPAKKGGRKILFDRTKPKIPHNKFIVRLDGHGAPVSVWTGSTNFTPSGFLGQTNVGHLVTDATTAKTYLELWTSLARDPDADSARARATKLGPNPGGVIPAKPPTAVFSPRYSDKMLDWYAQRIVDGRTSVMFTGAFGVAPKILNGLERHGDSLRFVMLEKPPAADVRKAEADNPDDVMVSYGAVLGQTYQKKAGAGGQKKLVPIPKFALDKWFLKEELARRDGTGFVFFVHTKFLLVDPLSDDPLVCTGSANFSSGSLTANDENMLLVRGDTRVADIYLTDFDRIFRHFYFRDVANEVAVRGGKSETVFLADTDAWSASSFDPKKLNCHRRVMFFADPKKSWVQQAPQDPDPFAGEKAGPKKAAKPKKKK
jgi:phosphatidylserine/phosphatidylglycerophosphate/cardiolipin synthase-like enzyme